MLSHSLVKLFNVSLVYALIDIFVDWHVYFGVNTRDLLLR